MNISKIVKKVLLEDDNVKGIDWNDQYSVLNAAKNYCPAYKEIIGDKEITLLKPELKSLFPELKNYQDLSSKNDQIDDSIFKIENSKKDLSNIITELSIVVDNLNSYKNKNNKDISDKSIDF